jgi:ubiquinone/menaquinone biosynthesis C-methylase UbiE|tara:strand:+ start:424 stop:1119 length:696 start_codon:yes stop_codon:yes gene_type:complete
MKKKIQIYNPEKNWTNLFYSKKDVSYQAECVIRIFKGKFPKFKLKLKKNDKILDVGFGDGRHIVFLKKMGLDVYGTEISVHIINRIKKLVKNVNKKLKVGTNDNLNFKSNYFNMLLSWNSCYYMSPEDPFNFQKHVFEISRVLKKNGTIIISIPKKTCFIFKDSKKIKKNYRIIKNDYFGVRNGQVMRCFENKNEIEKSFKSKFKKFIHSSIDINWFGLDYHWHVFIAVKK